MTIREREYLSCLIVGDMEGAGTIAIAPCILTIEDDPAPTLAERALWIARARWWMQQAG